MADLRKLSRQHRAQLGQIRSELAQLAHDLASIEEQLERILPFPAIANPADTKDKVVELPRRKKA